jgi:hypothetical protein
MLSRSVMKWKTCLCYTPPFELRFSYQVIHHDWNRKDVEPSFLPVARTMDRESDECPKIMTCKAINWVASIKCVGGGYEEMNDD